MGQGGGWGGSKEHGSEGVRPPRTQASPKSRKIMLMKTNGAHKGSLSPASRVLLWGFEFVPLTGGLGGQLQNSPSAAPHGQEPRTAPAESRGGEQSPESRGWVRRANRSPPGSPLWAMLSEPRWKSLELLIINSCMRERTHTQMYTQTPPCPPQISPAPGTGTEALTHTHVLHRRVGVSAAPRGDAWAAASRGRGPGSSQLAFAFFPRRKSRGRHSPLSSEPRGLGVVGSPQFPAAETRQRPCKGELKQSCRSCLSGRR